MKMLEKVRGYRLIAKIIAIAVFVSVGLQLINKLAHVAFRNAPTYGLSNTLLLKAPLIIAGIVFLLAKHDDKRFRYLFVAALAAANISGISSLISQYRFSSLVGVMFRTSVDLEAAFDVTNIMIAEKIIGLLCSAVIAVYYLGIVKPRGRKLFLVIFYSMLILNVLFSFSAMYFMPMMELPLYMLFVMYDYKESRCPNRKIVYIGLIGLVYYILYYLTSNLFFNLLMFRVFNILNLIACLLIPLLVLDRSVPSKQGGFNAMKGQPVNNGNNNIPK